jgi:hypothetical protein
MTIENLPNEEWRPVVGWESLYEVSNMGRIRSFPRRCWNGRVFWMMPSRIMHDYKAFSGYRCVTLNSGLAPVNILVHRVVASSFIPLDADRAYVNHINGDKTDNRAANLEWVTGSENICHALNTGLMKTRIPVCVTMADGSVMQFKSVQDACEHTGRNKTTISRAIKRGSPDRNGTTWSRM